MVPTLTLADFAFHTPLPGAKDWFKFGAAVAKALLKTANAKGDNVSLGGSMGDARPKNGRIALNVLGVKKRGLVCEFRVVQAIFDAKGKPVAWSFALDPDGDPRRPDGLCVSGLSADDIKRVLAINVKKKPAKAARAPAAFALERPASQVVAAGATVAVRTDGEVRLFDLAGAPRGTLKFSGRPRTMAISPDGTSVVSGLKKLALFTIEGEPVGTLEGHPRGEVCALAFNASGQRLVSASALLFQGGERRIALWDTATGKLIASRKLAEGPVCVGFTSDDGVLVGTTAPEAVLSFDAKLEPRAQRHFAPAQQMHPIGVAGGRMLVRVDAKLTFLDAGLEAEEVKVPKAPHSMTLFAASADGSRVLVVSPRAERNEWVFTARAWATATGKELLSRRLEGGGADGVFLPNGQLLLVAGRTVTAVALGR